MALKMYFHSYWYERLRLLSWKKLAPTKMLQKWVLTKFELLHVCFFMSWLSGFFLCLCFHYYDTTPCVQAELHNDWLFRDSMLRIHCCLQWPGTGSHWTSLPSMWWWDSLVMSPCAVYCEQEISGSVLPFEFSLQLVFNLTHSNFLAHH